MNLLEEEKPFPSIQQAIAARVKMSRIIIRNQKRLHNEQARQARQR